MLAPATVEDVGALAAEAGTVVSLIHGRQGHPAEPELRPEARTAAAAGFSFPDELWTRVIYDLIIAARRDPGAIDRNVAALVPIYFGRVASFVIENRDLSTDRAEDQVERQARDFEHQKAYLVRRWDSEAPVASRADRAG